MYSIILSLYKYHQPHNTWVYSFISYDIWYYENLFWIFFLNIRILLDSKYISTINIWGMTSKLKSKKIATS